MLQVTMNPKKHKKLTRRRTKARKAQCKHVVVILNNNWEIVPMLREKVYPPFGDFATDPLKVAVVSYLRREVEVPLGSVVFDLHEV
jgi:hypothetical protein